MLALAGKFFDSGIGTIISSQIAFLLGIVVPRAVWILLFFDLPGGVRKYLKNVYLRGSLASRRDFNPVMSDWDLGVVFKDLAENSQEQRNFCAAVSSCATRWKRFFPPIGEIEIYSENEMECLEQLLKSKKWGLLYADFRHVRKMGWMEAVLRRQREGGVGEYHIQKSLRALQRCYERLGLSRRLAEDRQSWEIALQIVLNRHEYLFKRDDGGRAEHKIEPKEYSGPPIYQLYLDRELNDKTVLTHNEVCRTFAVLPPGPMPAAISDEALMIRTSSAAGEACYKLAQIEAITLSGVIRGCLETKDSYRDWHKMLRDCQEQLREQCGKPFDVA